jgi:hypothetical protein
VVTSWTQQTLDNDSVVQMYNMTHSLDFAT